MYEVFQSPSKNGARDKRFIVIGGGGISRSLIKALIAHETKQNGLYTEEPIEPIIDFTMQDAKSTPLSTIHKKKKQAPFRKAHHRRKNY